MKATEKLGRAMILDLLCIKSLGQKTGATGQLRLNYQAVSQEQFDEALDNVVKTMELSRFNYNVEVFPGLNVNMIFID